MAQEWYETFWPMRNIVVPPPMRVKKTDEWWWALPVFPGVVLCWWQWWEAGWDLTEKYFGFISSPLSVSGLHSYLAIQTSLLSSAWKHFPETSFSSSWEINYNEEIQPLWVRKTFLKAIARLGRDRSEATELIRGNILSTLTLSPSCLLEESEWCLYDQPVRTERRRVMFVRSTSAQWISIPH